MIIYMHAWYYDHTCMITHEISWIDIADYDWYKCSWRKPAELRFVVFFLEVTHCTPTINSSQMRSVSSSLSVEASIIRLPCQGLRSAKKDIFTPIFQSFCGILIGRTWSSETDRFDKFDRTCCVRVMSMTTEEIWQFDKASRHKDVYKCFFPRKLFLFLGRLWQAKTHRGCNYSFVACLRTGGCIHAFGGVWVAHWQHVCKLKLNDPTEAKVLVPCVWSNTSRWSWFPEVESYIA